MSARGSYFFNSARGSRIREISTTWLGFPSCRLFKKIPAKFCIRSQRLWVGKCEFCDAIPVMGRELLIKLHADAAIRYM
jgi:hypothetical protein